MTLAKLITLLEQQITMKQKELLNRLAAEYESAKEQIILDFKIRGMSSEDVAKHNEVVRKVYADAGLPVTPYDLMQDFCAQTLLKLTEMYYKRVQDFMDYYKDTPNEK